MSSEQLAFSYLRFSTPEQQRGDSFRRQKDMAERYAREHGLTLDPRSFSDLGVSAFRGLNVKEGMLGVFLEAVEKGVIPADCYLLVESLDRISRNIPRKATRTLEDICEAGVTLVTLADGKVYDLETIDKDPMAMMMAYVVAIRAHEESERKSSRLKSVWTAKRAKAINKPMTSRAPAWLELDKERGEFVVLQDRAQIVRRMFTEYLGGKGTHGIAEGLNRDEVPTFGRSSFWNRSYVVKTLDNPSVIGRFTPHITEYVEGKRSRVPQDTIENYYPKVIEPEVFASVFTMRRGRRSPSMNSVGKPKVSHLLAGLAKCPKCSSSMIRVNKGSSTKSGHPYLICSKAKAGGDCEYHSVRLDKLEASILAQVSQLLSVAPSGSKTLKDIEERLAAEREKVSKQITPLIDFLADGEAVGVRERLMKLEARLQVIREEEEALVAEKSIRSPTLLLQRAKDLRSLLDAEEIEYVATNAIMRQVFKRVYIHWDLERLDFHWMHGGVTTL